MVYLLFGDNDFLVHQELSRLKDNLGPADMVGLNTTWLTGENLTLPDLRGVCDVVPFLAPARLVIVEALLARFNGGRPGRRTGAPTLEGGWDQLAGYCRQMPETTHLVLLDGPINRNNPLLSLLAPVAQVWERRRLRGAALEQWVRERASQLHCSLTPAALRLLIDVVGDNLWVLDSELEKLSLFTGGQPVQPQHVQELVASVRETNIFALVDAVAERKLQHAHRGLHLLLRDGLAPAYILFMLARQFRSLLQAKVLLAQGVTGAPLMGRLGITADYPFRKTVEQAQSSSATTLEEALRRLLEADVAIKTGNLAPEVALELLVTDLCGAKR